MKQRAAKRHAIGLRRALARVHERLEGSEFDLNLSRRAYTAMAGRAAHERAIAKQHMSRQASELELLRRWLSDIERIAGHYSIGAGMPKQKYMSMVPNEFDVEIREPFSPDRYLGVDPMQAITQRRAQLMRVMRSDCVRDRFTQAMHMRVTLADKAVVYALSDELLHGAPIEVMIPILAEQMSEMLLTDIRNGRAERQRRA